MGQRGNDTGLHGWNCWVSAFLQPSPRVDQKKRRRVILHGYAEESKLDSDGGFDRRIAGIRIPLLNPKANDRFYGMTLGTQSDVTRSESHEYAMSNGVPDAARPHVAGRLLPSAPQPFPSHVQRPQGRITGLSDDSTGFRDPLRLAFGRRYHATRRPTARISSERQPSESNAVVEVLPRRQRSAGAGAVCAD